MKKKAIWQLVEEELDRTKPQTIGELSPRFGELMTDYYRSPDADFVRCRSCDAINPGLEKFCLSCGSAQLEPVSDELPFKH